MDVVWGGRRGRVWTKEKDHLVSQHPRRGAALDIGAPVGLTTARPRGTCPRSGADLLERGLVT